MAHARLAPSNHRWPHCPGSVREEAAYPDSAGPAAIDGTGSHLLLEMSIAAWGYANQFLGQTIGVGHEDKPEGWLVTEDRVERVNTALSYIYQRFGELSSPVYGAKIGTESQVSPGKLCGRDDWFGTCDVDIRGADLLEVIDYKDGQGYVAAEQNTQLISYAIGKMVAQKDVDAVQTIRLTIVQPKTHPPVRYVDMSRADLETEAYTLIAAAQATDDPDAPLIAGDWCQWCKHRDNCPTKNGVALAKVSGDGDLMTVLAATPLVEQMTNEQLAVVLTHATNLKKIFDQVAEESLKRVKEGQTIPGFGLGNAAGSRYWNDDEEVAVKKLKSLGFTVAEIYPKVIISPTQAEKKEGLSRPKKEKLAEMIGTKAGKEKVVPAKNVRDIKEVFGDLPQEPAKPATPSFL